jgi:ferritin
VGHEELNEQVNGEFQAGRLKSFISEWEKITSDP